MSGDNATTSGQPAAEPCRWCGDLHGPLCPWVKAIEFDPTTGATTRVEFVTDADFPATVPRTPAAEPAPDNYERLGSHGSKGNTG